MRKYAGPWRGAGWQQIQQLRPIGIFRFVTARTFCDEPNDYLSALPHSEFRDLHGVVAERAQHRRTAPHAVWAVGSRPIEKSDGEFSVGKTRLRDQLAGRFISLPIMATPALNRECAEVFWEAKPQAPRLSE